MVLGKPWMMSAYIVEKKMGRSIQYLPVPRWRTERERCNRSLIEILTPDNLMDKLTEAEGCWNCINTMIHDIMSIKSEEESEEIDP
ncbi:hypothetical protein NQ314_004768 [Rhamnusium bicolor]|uniref:Uncharacterized protein n=1 Tax=Rhamnusium bicolor TaxID=1586634 RepID=A0AAV8ZL35_9CUCU|nr:hypothetical protein NQ314_004768 [Rhamnusium bicolor]